MIDRTKYSEILKNLQILYQNNQITKSEKDQIVTTMLKKDEKSLYKVAKSINAIKRYCIEPYLKSTCTRILELLKSEEN